MEHQNKMGTIINTSRTQTKKGQLNIICEIKECPGKKKVCSVYVENNNIAVMHEFLQGLQQ